MSQAQLQLPGKPGTPGRKKWVVAHNAIPQSPRKKEEMRDVTRMTILQLQYPWKTGDTRPEKMGGGTEGNPQSPRKKEGKGDATCITILQLQHLRKTGVARPEKYGSQRRHEKITWGIVPHSTYLEPSPYRNDGERAPPKEVHRA